MLFRFILGSWVIFQGSVLGVGALEIDQYDVVRRDVPGGEAPWWTLVFRGAEIEIPLLTTDGVFYDEEDDFGYVDAPYGSVIGPDGLQVRWLKEDKLVWVSWRTPPRGNGVYYDEVHIIVEVSGGTARELWRVDYPANGNQGAGERQHLDMTYAYDEQSGRVVETLERHDTDVFFHNYPLASKLGDGDTYILEERWIQRTEFTIGSRGLKSFRPTVSFELGETKVPIEEIARFVILRLSPRFQSWSHIDTVVDEITSTELARAVTLLKSSGQFDAETRLISGSLSLPYVRGIVGYAREPWEEEYVFRD